LVSSLKVASFSSRVMALMVVRGYASRECSLALPDSGRGDAEINGGFRHGIRSGSRRGREEFNIGVQNGALTAT
jgi:hypothetical protein